MPSPNTFFLPVQCFEEAVHFHQGEDRVSAKKLILGHGLEKLVLVITRATQSFAESVPFVVVGFASLYASTLCKRSKSRWRCHEVPKFISKLCASNQSCIPRVGIGLHGVLQVHQIFALWQTI